MSRVVYLDHAATTPVAPEVLEAMLPFLGRRHGNPSSVHGLGRDARNAVDSARDELAGAIGAAHSEITLTGSGTEADNLALRGVLDRHGAQRGRHAVVSAVEHDAVLDTARRLAEMGSVEVTLVACEESGAIDPERVAAAVRDDTALVSVMLVNNETGTLYDVRAIAEAVRRRNARTLLHCDAVQAFARLSVDVGALGVDLLSLSAHKIHGPKGVGALWVRRGVAVEPQISGGGQERGRRSGTENVAGIVGFAAAARLTERERETEQRRQGRLASRLVDLVGSAVPDTTVTGDATSRVAGFATFAFAGTRSDLLLANLDGRGVCASGGSACASGAPTPSHVLLAMGLPPPLAAAALRLTTGRETGDDDVEFAAVAVARAVAQVRDAATTATGWRSRAGSNRAGPGPPEPPGRPGWSPSTAARGARTPARRR